MLGARIDVVEASIWNFYRLPAVSARQKTTTDVIKCDKTSNWTETIIKNAGVFSSHFLSENI